MTTHLGSGAASRRSRDTPGPNRTPSRTGPKPTGRLRQRLGAAKRQLPMIRRQFEEQRGYFTHPQHGAARGNRGGRMTKPFTVSNLQADSVSHLTPVSHSAPQNTREANEWQGVLDDEGRTISR